MVSLPIPTPTKQKNIKHFCCTKNSREYHDKQLAKKVLPLVPRGGIISSNNNNNNNNAYFSSEPQQSHQQKQQLNEWILPFDADMLPSSTGSPTELNSFIILREIFLFIGFELDTLLTIGLVNRAWYILSDYHPAYKYLLPCRPTLAATAITLNWNCPRAITRVYEKDPYVVIIKKKKGEKEEKEEKQEKEKEEKENVFFETFGSNRVIDNNNDNNNYPSAIPEKIIEVDTLSSSSSSGNDESNDDDDDDEDNTTNQYSSSSKKRNKNNSSDTYFLEQEQQCQFHRDHVRHYKLQALSRREREEIYDVRNFRRMYCFRDEDDENDIYHEKSSSSSRQKNQEKDKEEASKNLFSRIFGLFSGDEQSSSSSSSSSFIFSDFNYIGCCTKYQEVPLDALELENIRRLKRTKYSSSSDKFSKAAGVVDVLTTEEQHLAKYTMKDQKNDVVNWVTRLANVGIEMVTTDSTSHLLNSGDNNSSGGYNYHAMSDNNDNNNDSHSKKHDSKHENNNNAAAASSSSFHNNNAPFEKDTSNSSSLVTVPENEAEDEKEKEDQEEETEEEKKKKKKKKIETKTETIRFLDLDEVVLAPMKEIVAKKSQKFSSSSSSIHNNKKQQQNEKNDSSEKFLHDCKNNNGSSSSNIEEDNENQVSATATGRKHHQIPEDDDENNSNNASAAAASSSSSTSPPRRKIRNPTVSNNTTNTNNTDNNNKDEKSEENNDNNNNNEEQQQQMYTEGLRQENPIVCIRDKTLLKNRRKLFKPEFTEWRRKNLFVTKSAFTNTVRTILNHLDDNVKLSCSDIYPPVIWKFILTTFCVLVAVLVLTFFGGLFIDHTTFQQNDRGFSAELGLIVGALLLIMSCRLITTWTNEFTKIDEVTGNEEHLDGQYPATGSKLCGHLWSVFVLLSLAIPMALLNFRVNVSDSLIRGGVISVCDAFEKSNFDTSLVGTTTSWRIPDSGNSFMLQCQLPEELLPKKLVEATFVAFPRGTRFLFHPTAAEVPRNVLFTSTRTSSFAQTCTISQNQPVSFDDSGSEDSEKNINRGKYSYVTAFFPNSTTSNSSCNNNNLVTNSITLLIISSVYDCGWWTTNPLQSSFDPLLFKGILQNESAANAISNSSLLPHSSQLEFAIASQRPTSDLRCRSPENALVTVISDNFMLRVSKYSTHYSSSYFSGQLPIKKSPWRHRTRWTQTLDWNLNGIVSLTADSSMFVAHKNEASPIVPTLVSPFSSSSSSSSSFSGNNNSSNEEHDNDIWTAATMSGLKTIKHDMFAGSIGLLLFILISYATICLLTYFSFGLLRLYFVRVIMILVFFLFVLPIPTLTITAICKNYLYSETYDELRAPVFCLASNRNNIDGALIATAVMIGICGCIVCMMTCAACSKK